MLMVILERTILRYHLSIQKRQSTKGWKLQELGEEKRPTERPINPPQKDRQEKLRKSTDPQAAMKNSKQG